MCVEIVVGTLLLLLGWQCFRQASRARTSCSRLTAPRVRPYVEMPAVVTQTLGALLVLSGMALLSLSVF